MKDKDPPAWMIVLFVVIAIVAGIYGGKQKMTENNSENNISMQDPDDNFVILTYRNGSHVELMAQTERDLRKKLLEDEMNSVDKNLIPISARAILLEEGGLDRGERTFLAAGSNDIAAYLWRNATR